MLEILVIEDNKRKLEATEEYLKDVNQDINITVVECIHDFKLAVKDKEFHGIVIDMQLPNHHNGSIDRKGGISILQYLDAKEIKSIRCVNTSAEDTRDTLKEAGYEKEQCIINNNMYNCISSFKTFIDKVFASLEIKEEEPLTIIRTINDVKELGKLDIVMVEVELTDEDTDIQKAKISSNFSIGENELTIPNNKHVMELYVTERNNVNITIELSMLTTKCLFPIAEMIVKYVKPMNVEFANITVITPKGLYNIVVHEFINNNDTISLTGVLSFVETLIITHTVENLEDTRIVSFTPHESLDPDHKGYLEDFMTSSTVIVSNKVTETNN